MFVTGRLAAFLDAVPAYTKNPFAGERNKHGKSKAIFFIRTMDLGHR